ncbi:hypothetical protein PWT90_00192 [Aphanocladium album]|nr:hypothetical protein PWT90_00192 [Aphanocladium album]
MLGSLKVLQDALSFIPRSLNDYFYSFDTAARIDKYLSSTEQPTDIERNGSHCIAFDGATVAWPSDEHGKPGDDPKSESTPHTFSLNDVTLQFPPGELSIISGKIGSGKSLLLASILGEADLLQGRITAPADEDNSVAYVAQVPWLHSGTIEENILFGSPMNRKRYEMVISACALRPDLSQLADGDQTRIGLRGVKLSGGQRARIGFARALFSSAKTMVLDDIFSSLDTHVANEIFDALTGELGSGRTRILVTHNISLCLPCAKYLVQLQNNRVSYAGEPGAVDAKIEPTEPTETAEPPVAAPTHGTTQRKFDQVKTGATKESPRTRTSSLQRYFGAAGGICFTAIYVFWIIAGRLLDALASDLLGRIKSHKPSLSSAPNATAEAVAEGHVFQSISVYFGTVVLLIAVTTLSKLHSNVAALHAARVLFRRMVARVLRMPLLWLDSTPLGVTLKVFTIDFGVVDDSPLATIASFADGALNVLTVVGIGLYTSLYTGIATVLLLIWCKALMSRYNRATPMVQRTGKGPMADVLEHVTTTDAGIATIRAFRATDSCTATLNRHLDALATQRRNSDIFNQWLSSVSHIGFSLTFAMQLSSTIGSTWSRFDALVMCLNSLSSVIGYTELEVEDQGGEDVPDEWPSNGEVHVKELEISYAATLPPALKDMSFQLAPGERVGVVGRTGSGKSTLTLSLLRLLHAQKGIIRIDGLDISTLKVSVLRSRIGFIPQSPNLFDGTVRSNLDYFGKLSDEKIDEALRNVQLLHEGDNGSSRFTASSKIAAGGSNLSQGQRQLLCLARIILQNPKIIILDEATSAVDGETDTVIQQVIRDMFDGTLIVVAHRLETVVALDRILVMKDGVVAENGSPAELFRANGIFRNLMEQSQDSASLKKMILG